MKKRVFSALLVLCMACSLVSTVWASPSTPETATPETAAPASPTPSPTPDVSAYPARAVEQTVEGSGVTVQVDIPAGSLPADARLTAELLGASTDADAADTVADVAAELDEADVDYDGFVALDISFVDAAGAKIEPLQPVSVSFSLPADLLPAEADPATLAVQHLAEDADGEVETVETVADVADETDGTVTVETGAAALSLEEDAAALPADAEVKAEFEVDGFSAMVLTWNTAETAEAAAYSAGAETRAVVDSNGESSYRFYWEAWRDRVLQDSLYVSEYVTIELWDIDNQTAIPVTDFTLDGNIPAQMNGNSPVNDSDGTVLYALNNGTTIQLNSNTVPQLNGYCYTQATYKYDDESDWSKTISSIRTNNQTHLSRYNYRWYYYINGSDTGVHFDGNHITIRLNYQPALYIDDQVMENGSLVPTFRDGQVHSNVVSYVWEKCDSRGGTYSPVARENTVGTSYNMEENGSALYPALDDGARQYGDGIRCEHPGAGVGKQGG